MKLPLKTIAILFLKVSLKDKGINKITGEIAISDGVKIRKFSPMSVNTKTKRTFKSLFSFYLSKKDLI